MIQLYPHSQKAYDNLISMLHDTHKAAVIHPTGCGKSFIAFKLTEQFPEKRFVWLSPSETIYKHQCESVYRNYAYQAENVLFMTYAKLLYASQIEIERLEPEFIILDEFHRCGAKEWGIGVERLINTYPNAELVGFSATNIRYLDNNRDMAIELFDGCIADQITLPEAIAQGILPAPKYVVSIYSYEQTLQKLEQRRKRGGLAAQKNTQVYYEKLRRALAQAPTLAQVFKKHMQETKGKYIVFCASIDHLKDMINRAKTDFSLIDEHPHIYQFYEGAPSMQASFTEFQDDKSDHLKLLYCIDMLNEGVHITNLSGVIMFRPTVSPIVYKQQLGRALSIGFGQTPIIFDIVNNFDGLYSISAVASEISEMIELYRRENHADQNEIIGFEIIDEIRDCREILQQIENSLASTWDTMYLEAEIYYRENGNLSVPKNYRIKDSNLPLGQWISTQRRVYKGAISGTLTPIQIEKLEHIGMIWDDSYEHAWKVGFSHAQEYYKGFQHLNVESRYICDDGYHLGAWIKRQRYRLNGLIGKGLTAQQIEMLDSIGMIWDPSDDAFNKGLSALKKYKKEYGNINVPVSYVTDDGFRLGRWVDNKRHILKKRTPSPYLQNQILKLKQIGLYPSTKYDNSWYSCFQEVEFYLQNHGNLDMRSDYIQNGKHIYDWLMHQRDKLLSGKLSQDRIDNLKRLNPGWDVWLQKHMKRK